MFFVLWFSAILWAASATTARTCTTLTIPITISALNAVFDNTPIPQTSLDADAFALNITRQGINYTAQALTGYATVSGSYNISAQYCTPSIASPSPRVLQILTHGIGFDKTYWDLAYPLNNSYVNEATQKFSYFTFAYDRLGIGASSQGDPRNVIQNPLELAALVQLTQRLRSNTIPGINQIFDKVVHVGHSYGSIQTYTLSSMYPSLSDAVVLTGFATNSSFLPMFFAGADYQQANQQGLSQYPNGYLVSNLLTSLQYTFLLPGHFDPNVPAYAQSIKQPATIGELLTAGMAPLQSSYTGPVLIQTGSNDVPFCGGNCLATGTSAPNIPSEAKAAFPHAKSFQAVIQPNTAHALALHNNASAGFDVILNWLGANGF